MMTDRNDPRGMAMTHHNQGTRAQAKVAARDYPVGLIILGIGGIYVALCLKVFSGF